MNTFGTGVSTTGSNLIGDPGNSGLTSGSTVTVNPAPKLSPLGHYGGPTQTMHPLADSPAILSTPNVTRTDQRGFRLAGPPTIGAVKLGSIFTVLNNSESDTDSLRDEINQASSSPDPGAIIRFEGLVTNTITLGSSGQLVVPGTADGLFIDASDLPNGLTIDAGGQSRVMEIRPGATAALNGLTLTGGLASGASPADSGGAIYNDQATLSLSGCTLSGNIANRNGGGIYSVGRNGGSAKLSLSGCTLSDNSATLGTGGGILSGSNSGSATLSLSACTLTGNSADTSDGGGIYSFTTFGSVTLSLSACTFTGNAANDGGGIYSDNVLGSATLSLNNSILAGNTATTGPDLRVFDTTITATGNNLIGDVENTELQDNVGGVIVAADPMLAPLGDYGGPTQTMIPLPGSQAIDAATTSTRSTDQRGFPITGGTPDIGAVEFQGADDLAPLLDIDQDGDGTTFGIELALGTDPFVSDPGNPRNPTLSINSTTGATTLNFGISPAAAGVVALVLERSTDLETWSRAFQSNPDSFSNAASFSLSGNDAGPRTFYRFTAEPR